MQNFKQYSTVLTIAGSDSCGGAGIQADIKSIAATGSYAAAVVTALTAQNTQGVSAIFEVASEFVAEQLDSVFSDIHFGAIKIGMLHKPAVIEIVAQKLQYWAAKNIILDPVMLAKAGNKLLTDAALITLKERLLPLVYLVTPNLDEAEVLLNRNITSLSAMQQAAGDLANTFKINVLIKGGHLQQPLSTDVLFLYQEKTYHLFQSERVLTKNTHGTGCTFAAAIASYLAQQNSLLAAVAKAKKYISAAIAAGKDYQLGKGIGPVQHFFNLAEQDK